MPIFPPRFRSGTALALTLAVAAAAPLPLAEPAAATTASDNGRVFLSGRALADADGPFPALGATFFWALWGEAHDPDRLDANLAWLAAHGVDYVRVLGMVGSESWNDRRIDPADASYWPTVDRLLARLARHHLRAQVTIFADAQVMMPDPGARQAFVDRWAARVDRSPERFVMLEIANEHFQNGIADVDELRALGRRAAATTSVPVALSSPAGDACALYAGSAADLATLHYPRDVSASGGWEPVWQPWRYPSAYDGGCRGLLPVAVNNEPIGPGSSVVGDSDPLRLAMAYVVTFLSQHAAYVFHAGPGIRGGGQADRALGRPADFHDAAELQPPMKALHAARRYLPPDVANWERVERTDGAFPFGGVGEPVIGVARGDRFVVAVVGAAHDVEASARRALELQVIDPATGDVIQSRTLQAGDTLLLPVHRPGGAGFVLIGR